MRLLAGPGARADLERVMATEPAFAVGFDRAQAEYDTAEPDWEEQPEWDEARDEAEREYAEEQRREMRELRAEEGWEW